MKRFFDPPKKNPSDAKPQHLANLKARRKNWLTAHLYAFCLVAVDRKMVIGVYYQGQD